jgi:hypothetical protein
VGGTRVSPAGRQEFLRQRRDRYAVAGRAERSRLLTEAATMTGYHRKALIRRFTRPEPGEGRRRRGRPRQYGPAAVAALRAVWRAARYPWSVRLNVLLPLWVPRARGRLRLTPGVEAQLRRMSPRQIDRLLQADKRQVRRRLYGRTKPGTLLKHHVPLRTDRWNVATPGFTEVDLVAHSGDRADGEFAHTVKIIGSISGPRAARRATVNITPVLRRGPRPPRPPQCTGDGRVFDTGRIITRNAAGDAASGSRVLPVQPAERAAADA